MSIHGTVSLPDNPEEFLATLGLTCPQNYQDLQHEITKEKYKYANTIPGELIKLRSYIVQTALFVYKDDHDTLHLIIKHANQYYKLGYLLSYNQIDNTTTLVSLFLTPFCLSQALLLFIKNTIQDSDSYLPDLEKKQNDIEELSINQNMVIYPAKQDNTPCATLHIIKNAEEQYSVLLFDPEKNIYRHADKSLKHIFHYDNTNNIWLTESAIQFLYRVHTLKNSEKLQKNDTLQLKNGLALLLENTNIKKQFMLNKSFSIDKKVSKSAKKLHIIYKTTTDEWMLLVNTKEEIHTTNKKTMITRFFRIDSEKIEHWVRKTYSEQKQNHKTEYEAHFSQNLSVSNQDYADLYNVTFLGSPSLSILSQYSPSAIHDLEQVLSERKIDLDDTDNARIAECLLKGVLWMHQENKIHQDIKPKNILIYRDEDGYYAKLADFEMSHNRFFTNNSSACGTFHYESPEILCAYSEALSVYHYYYWDEHGTNSYAHHILKSKNIDLTHTDYTALRKPHPANDMWSLGVVLFKLLNDGHEPSMEETKQTRIQNTPLLKGLLHDERHKRYTCQQALNMFNHSRQMGNAGTADYNFMDSLSALISEFGKLFTANVDEQTNHIKQPPTLTFSNIYPKKEEHNPNAYTSLIKETSFFNIFYGV